MSDACISRDELKNLLANPDTSERIAIAESIAQRYKGQALLPDEKAQLKSILSLIARDTEILVRLALVRILKEHADFPYDIAVRMLDDLDTIALPLLQYCEVLQDEDLLNTVVGGNRLRQRTVAGRRTVSENVSSALVIHGDYDTHSVLGRNNGANISENALFALLEKYPGDTRMQHTLATRDTLPPAFTEKLLDVVGENVKEYLLSHAIVSPEVARRVVAIAREGTLAQSAAAPGMPDSELHQMVSNLHQQQRLSDAVLATALCNGNVRFFEIALAKRAAVTVMAVHRVLASSENAFKALCSKAGIPSPWAKLMRMLYAQCVVSAEMKGSSLYDSSARASMMQLSLTGEKPLPPQVMNQTLKVASGKKAALHH